MTFDWSPEDEEDLRKAISRTTSNTRLGRPESVLIGVEHAWVLIFNPGKHDEGVYTLQGRTTQASSYVLAFEYTDDAERFAQLLQAEGFDLATPLLWNRDQLSTFCAAGAFEVSLVPEGSLITPPAKNEYDLDAFKELEEQAEMGDGLDAEKGFNELVSERLMFERLFQQPGDDGAPGV